MATVSTASLARGSALREMGCLILMVCLLSQVVAVQAEEWSRWRGPRGDGTWQPTKEVLENLPAQWPAELPHVWTQPLGPGYSGITVSQGRVVTMDRPAEPTNHERIVCFDAATGKKLWEHLYAASYEGIDYQQGPRSAPTLHEGRVYTLGAVGHAHCLDLKTGKVLWQLDLVRDHQAKLPTWGLAASPVVYGDQLLLHAGLPGGCYSSHNLATGQEQWRSGDDPAGYATPRIVAQAGRDVLIGWTPKHVLALDPRTGNELWNVPYEVTYGVSIADPIVPEGTVLVAGYWEGTKAIRLGNEAGEAELMWEENKFLRGLMSQPLYRQGHVFLLDKQHGLVCFRLSDGQKVWSDGYRLTKRDRNPQASLVWLGNSDRALALNAEGQLVQLRLTPEKYEEHTRTQLVKPTWAHPAFMGEYVFARDDQQIVCAKLTSTAAEAE
jgi:outer membrane protein assembly factor BamB